MRGAERAEAGSGVGVGAGSRGGGGGGGAGTRAGPQGRRRVGPAGQPRLVNPKSLADYKALLRRLHRKKLHMLARDLYGEMLLDGVSPDHELFEELVRGSVHAMHPGDALFFFGQVQEMGMQPTLELYSSAIRAHGMQRDPVQAARVADQLRASGMPADGPFYVALLSACASVGDLEGAERIIQEMEAERVPLGQEMLCLVLVAAKNCPPARGADPGAALLDRLEDLLELVKERPGALGSEMPRAIEMDLMNSAIDCAVELKRYDLKDELLWRLTGRRMTLDRNTYAHLLRAELQQLYDTRSEAHIDKVLELVDEMREAGMYMQVSTIVMGLDW